MNKNISNSLFRIDKPKRRPRLLALEPRIVLDAAAVVTAVEATGDGFDSVAPVNDTIEQNDALADFAEGVNTEDQRNEIAFITTGVENYQDIIAQIDPNVEIVVLDGTENGVERMAEILAGRDDLDAIHIISHGNDGELVVGNSVLNLETINGEYGDELAAIGAALSASGDILIYGCDFGQGETGVRTAEALAAATGADIAASDDETGHAALGGDWDLEVSVGQNETVAIVAADWLGKLASFADDGGNNDISNDDFDITAIDIDYSDVANGNLAGFVQMDPSGGSSVFMSLIVDVDGDGNANYDYFVELDATSPHVIGDFNLYYGVKDSNANKLSGKTSTVAFDATNPSTATLSTEDNPFEGATNQDSRITYYINLDEIVNDWNARFPSDPITYADVQIINATTHTSASPTSQIKDEQFDSSLSATPSATDDVAATVQNTDVIIDVLDNDNRLAFTDVSIVSGSGPALGSVVVNSDGTITYSPGTGLAGSDSFQYQSIGTDGNLYTATVDVVIALGTANSDPTVSGPVTTTDSEDDAAFSLDLLTGASDPDAGDTRCRPGQRCPGRHIRQRHRRRGRNRCRAQPDSARRRRRRYPDHCRQPGPGRRTGRRRLCRRRHRRNPGARRRRQPVGRGVRFAYLHAGRRLCRNRRRHHLFRLRRHNRNSRIHHARHQCRQRRPDIGRRVGHHRRGYQPRLRRRGLRLCRRR